MRIRYTFQNNFFLLKKVFKYNRLLFICRILIATLSSVQVILTIMMPMYLLESIIDGNLSRTINVVIFFTIPFLIIKYTSIIFSAYDKLASEKMYVEIINEFLQKTMDLDLGYFDNTKSYDKYNRAFGNCCRVIDSINSIVYGFIASLFNFAFIIGILIWMNVYVFIAIFCIIIFNFIINNKLKNIDYYYSKLFSEKNKQVNYLYRLFYIPQLVREMKASYISNFIFKIKQSFNEDIIRLTKNHVYKKSIFSFFTETISILESSLVALYFGFTVIAGKIAVSEYFTYINAYNQLKNTVMNLMTIYTNLYSNSLFASDYIDFLNSKENITLNTDGEILKEVNKIEFVNVSFKYPNNTDLTLDNASFKILKGDKVAIIGKNGAGKTTIIKLLLRLYDPSSGQILINDINIKNYNTKSLRTSIQTLFQDFAMYAFSIKDNIALGRNIDDSSIWESLEKVDLKEKIENLQLSIETPITSQLYNGGIELSGGESQKLAIARIYASMPKTFIMDEPTSNLDPYAEYLLYNRLIEDTNRDSTVIIISHRLTLTYIMSKIIVIEQGCVIEEGTHQELMDIKGTYFNMYNVQADKYFTNTNRGGK